MTTRRGVRKLLFYKRLIAALRRREEGLAPYRRMHALVRGTPEEATFWDMMREMAHLHDIRRLLDRQNGALLSAARDRDRLQFRLGRRCSDCRHWTVPTWDTKGWGTCYQASAARDAKRLPLIRASGDRSSIHTSKAFSCVSWEARP